MKSIFAAICLSLTGGLFGYTARANDPPNIVIIMSDDMGYSDIGCYGSEIETPNLDGLAQEGVRFTQFYNTARCCPTRASLLTGLYAHQAGIGHMVDTKGKNLADSYSGELSHKAVTLAEVLKSAGYATYVSGKWHVTRVTKPTSDTEIHNWPLQRGFDHFYGTIHGAGSFFDPNSLVRDNHLISPFADPANRPGEFYYTDAIGDQASRFVTQHHESNPKQPFFLYVAYTSAHWPMHAKPTDIAKYRGKYDKGYDSIRANRFEKMRSLGLVDDRWQISPPVGKWDAVENKAWEVRCMEVYAAMIDCMDQGIGRLVSSLKETGQYDNTIILYLQDNGACAESLGRDGEYVERANLPPLASLGPFYLQPDMIPKQTREGYPVRQGKGVMPGDPDTFTSYGRAWANVSNTPFREYKHWQHEGGISTPLIAHWPKGLPKSRHGKLQPYPSHLIDLMATCVELSGAVYPKQFGGSDVQPTEGISLVPAIISDISERTQPIFWEHEGNRAVRVDRWKLVSKHTGAWELYDIEADRTELHDLASKDAVRVKEMSALWDIWGSRVGVLPWPLEDADQISK